MRGLQCVKGCLCLAVLLMLLGAPAFASKKSALKTMFGANITFDNTDYKAAELFSGDVDDSTGFSLVAAYPIQPWFAAEVGYVKLGDADFNGLFEGTTDVGTIEVDGIRYGFLGAWPVSRRLSLQARLGAFSWDLEENEVFGGVPESATGSGTDLMYGAGVQVELSKRFDGRIEWIRYNGVGEFGVGSGDGDTDSISLGVTFRLRGPYFGKKRADIEE